MLVYRLSFFFSSRRRHTRCSRDWSSDVCSSDLDRATGVTLSDTWPSGFTRGTITPSQGTCTPATTGQNFTCALGTLAKGGSATVTVTYTVPASTTGSQTNTVTVSSDTPDPVAGNNTASDTNTVATSADLSVTKTDLVTTVTAGDGVTRTYTITVSNTAGPSDATGVTLSDTWPSGFTRGTITPSQGTCTPATTGQNFTCALGTLAKGGSATVTVTYTVPASTTGSQTNTVTVSSDTPDPVAGNNTSSDTNTVATSADLSVTKTDLVTTVTAGDGVTRTYTITVSNTAGPSDATGVTLSDTWPSGFTRGTITPSQGTCTPATTGQNFTCALGTLAKGGSATVTVTYTVPASTTGSQTNTVTVSSDTPDPVAGNNTASDTNTVATSADLSVTKTDLVTTVTAGDGVTRTYTITVSNTAGPSDATGVTLSDTWPSGFTRGTITPSQGTCTPATTGQNFTCALGTLAKGGSATVTVTYTVPASTTGSQTNTVTVSSDTPDPVAGNNTASDTNTVATSADLSVTKTDLVTTVTAGDGVTRTYTITVSNTAGPSDATGVTLSDTWPSGFTRGTITPSQGTCTPATTGQNFTCALGTLAKGGSATVTVTYTVPASTTGSQTNTVTVSSDTPDPVAGNNTASDTNTVATSADLSVTKTDLVTTVTAGDGVTRTYTITVSNTAGPSDATGVTLSDTWPSGFTRGTITPSQGTCTPATTGQNFTCALGTLAKGGSATVTVTYTVPASTTGSQTNTVTVSSDTPDP